MVTKRETSREGENPTVNRYLTDKAMDHIDHALGRPIWPLRESYRNYFATDATSALAIEFGYSPYWEFCGQSGDMAYFSVTDAGRAALAAHLATQERPHRAYAVTFEGHTRIVPARSRSGARYSSWLSVSDCYCDLAFTDFIKQSQVRAA